MKKFLSLLVSGFLMVGVVTTSAMADPAKGQKVYLKYLKNVLGFNGAKFAAKHTQDEWEELFANGGEGFKKEFGVNEKAKKFFEGEKFKQIMPHIKDFAIEYASDSGNVPSC